MAVNHQAMLRLFTRLAHTASARSIPGAPPATAKSDRIRPSIRPVSQS